MNRSLKMTFWTIASVLLIGLIVFVWILFGNPYPRLHLLGTQYLQDTDKLYLLSQEQKQPYYLIKKYKYSKTEWLIGYSGDGSRTDNYYGLGIADQNKNEILSPKYKFLFAKQDDKTKEIYIFCVPYRKTGHEPDEYFKLENNKLIAISREY